MITQFDTEILKAYEEKLWSAPLKKERVQQFNKALKKEIKKYLKEKKSK